MKQKPENVQDLLALNVVIRRKKRTYSSPSTTQDSSDSYNHRRRHRSRSRKSRHRSRSRERHRYHADKHDRSTTEYKDQKKT